MIEKSIRKVLQCETDYFRNIINEYKDKAYTLAISVVGSEAIAKDIVQEAFLKAFRNLNTFKGDAKFSTWFYRIVVNEAYNTHKKQKKYIRVDFESSENQESFSSGETSNKIDEDNQKFFVNKALGMLPPDYSLVLRLFYLEEFNTKEISEITGWTNSNTRVLLHRGRKKMEEVLVNKFNQKKEDLF